MKKTKIGIGMNAIGIVVRGTKHLSECYVAMFPNDSKDEDCTCWDDSPDWTDD